MQEIQSPCIGICSMSETNGLCMGCYRTIEEIEQWWDMTNAQRSQVITQLPEREQSVFDH
ncbi:MAG TPA: DUF1289 domain-containing protein [Methyloradius sp.]